MVHEVKLDRFELSIMFCPRHSVLSATENAIFLPLDLLEFVVMNIFGRLPDSSSARQ